MQFFITILHVMLCFALVGIILLQPGKEGASVLGGGGGNQMYAPRGQGNLLTRGTSLVAALFMATSIGLAWYSTDRMQSGSDVGDELKRLQEQSGAAPSAGPADAPSTAAPSPTPLPVEAPAGDAAPAPGGAVPATGDVAPAPTPQEAPAAAAPPAPAAPTP